jgi:hypothetical protein
MKKFCGTCRGFNSFSALFQLTFFSARREAPFRMRTGDPAPAHAYVMIEILVPGSKEAAGGTDIEFLKTKA